MFPLAPTTTTRIPGKGYALAVADANSPRIAETIVGNGVSVAISGQTEQRVGERGQDVGERGQDVGERGQHAGERGQHAGERGQHVSEPDGGHSPQQYRPLGGYAVLTATFTSLAASFAWWLRRSGRELPERMPVGDLLLMTLATHKVARLIAKDRVTSAVRAPFTRYEGDAGPAEVKETPRGRGIRRAIGELIACPYCLGLWIGAAFSAGLIVAPRPTRWIASVFTIFFGSDLLQIAYKKAEDTL
jgi:hypothetical protein